MPRIAWFSPLPPVRSGIAAYTAEAVPLLERAIDIDVYDHARSHNFVWTQAKRPYDLCVYQLGNSLSHAYMWAYLTRYPGLTVLHDAQLHQSRALDLLRQRREQDYRAEFRFSHPDAPDGIADLVAAGLGGTLYYLWPMLRLAVESSRAIAVHSESLAAALRQQFPGASFSVIPMGVRAAGAAPSAEERVRARHNIPDGAIVFGAYGKVTPAKRIEPMLHALARVARTDPRVHALIAGESTEELDVRRMARDLGIAERVTVAGYVDDALLDEYVQAADVCVCLRWPSAGETSAVWLRCLAAGKATIVTQLAQMRDVAFVDAASMGTTKRSGDEVCVAIDVLDEDRALEVAMRRLSGDPALRAMLGTNAQRYWRDDHTLDRMAGRYLEVIETAMRRPIPVAAGLAHVRADGTALAAHLTAQVGVTVDFLG